MKSKSKLKAKSKPLSAEEKAVYTAVTERVKINEDYGKCEWCGNLVLMSLIQRHHIVHRSQGGKTIEQNVVAICLSCHDDHHNHRLNKEQKNEL